MKTLKSILVAATAAVSMGAPEVMAQDTQGYTGAGMGKHIAVLEVGESNPPAYATMEVDGIEACAGETVNRTVNFNKAVKLLCIDSNEKAVFSGTCIPNNSTEPKCTWAALRP